MTKEETVHYWLRIANSDLDLAEYIFEGGRWLYVAFMCHQAIEKVLKAYWAAHRDDAPPYTHSHTKLIEECGLAVEMSQEQLRFIDLMVPMNIEARYPSYKESVAATLTEDAARYILESTKSLKEWIEERL